MSERRKLRDHLVPILIYLVGYCACAGPALAKFTTHIFSGGIDGSQGMWGYWWVRYAVAHGKLPWHTDYLYHPDGVTLFGAVLIPFNGFLSIPLCWFVDQVTAYNLLIVFSFVATGYTTFLLAREVCGRWWPSVFAGAVVTFSPFHFGHAGGHMHMVAIEWLPLFLLMWLRLLRQPGYGRALLAAAALSLVLLCDYYQTFYAVLVGTLMFLWTAGVERRSGPLLTRRGFLSLAAFVGASLILCGPILAGLIGAMHGDPLAGAHESDLWRNDLFGFLIPGSVWRFHEWTEAYWSLHPIGGSWYETGSHLGLTVLAAGTYAVVIGRRTGTGRVVALWASLGVLAYILSLGNELLVMGKSIPEVPMPHELLELIPGLSLAGMPIRLTLITYIALAVLSAQGLAHAWTRLPGSRKFMVPFVALFALEYWPRPQRLHRPPITDVIRQLERMPDGAVTGFQRLDPRALYHQTLFHKPITGGYVARVPQSLLDRSAEMDQLWRGGHYREMIDRTRATYLLRDRAAMPPVQDPTLKLVAVDEYFELFAVPSSPLPTIERPPELQFVRALPSTPDRELILELTARGDAGRKFCCLFSLAKVAPYQSAFKVEIEVAEDVLFRTSANQDNQLFRGNWGTLDADGQARITIDRRLIGSGHAAWCTLVVFEDPLRQAVRRVFRPVQLTLR